MTHELIEQKEITLITVGGSKAIVVPATWLDRLQLTDETTIRLRLSKGKHGIFMDAYKKKGR